MKSFFTLLKNETKLNVRDMNMVLFAVFMPLVVLVILGFVYGSKPAFDGASYISWNSLSVQYVLFLCALEV